MLIELNDEFAAAAKTILRAAGRYDIADTIEHSQTALHADVSSQDDASLGSPDDPSSVAYFLNEIQNDLAYWRQLPDEQLTKDDKIFARMSGLVFSILVLIDGERDLFPFILARGCDNADLDVANNISGHLHEVWSDFSHAAEAQVRSHLEGSTPQSGSPSAGAEPSVNEQIEALKKLADKLRK